MRLSILAALAAFGSVAVAQLKATVVVENIQVLTTKSQALIQPAKELTIVNAPLLILGQGPWASSSASTTYVGAEATAIANAFRLFVKVHQQLLDALIGAGGVITKIPFVGPPVAAVLRSVEKVVDTLALGIIATVEASVAVTMKTDYAGLRVTLGTAVGTFS
ncbi:hypothetical protein C8A01DRAFT_48840 [Parachaetomium inaequale]|uniref:Uncharacterized protein n=1 Tax=Parachaetomium inaequale TaxID=2588326 RepID=A0AAN6SPI3_9PEZI|nr:hypothetical protein C8A01DRAFT_48840 [Parachaetomium inaequale]